MAEVHQLQLKIHMTYVENIFDCIEILCRNIKRYNVEHLLELCCYFKTKPVFIFIWVFHSEHRTWTVKRL